MIIDNIRFTQEPVPIDRIQITGIYSVDFSISTSKAELDSGGKKMKEDIRKLITEQCRKIIIADALDVPFLKLLYKSDVMKQLVIDSLDIRAFNLRTMLSPGNPRKDTEEVKMLDELIYKLRTLPNDET